MKTVYIPTNDGTVKEFKVHKFLPTEGRAIVSGYPLALLSKEFSYAKNEQAMFALFKYVSVPGENGDIRLSSIDLINEHVPDWFALVMLEWETLKYNCSFLDGMNLLDLAKAKVSETVKDIIADYVNSRLEESVEPSTSKLLQN